MSKTPKLKLVQTQLEDEKPLIVRPEKNLDRLPAIWTPSSARSEKVGVKVIEYEQVLDDKTIKGRLEVRPATRNEDGVTVLVTLTTFDQLVFLALVKTWEEQGAKDGFTFLSLRKLAKDLNIGWGGKTVKTLENSLSRLNGVKLDWKKFISKKGSKAVFEVDEPIMILTEYKIIKRKVEGEITKEKGYFLFHSAVLNNLKNDYTRPLLFNVVRSFKSDIAQLIYTYVDRILAYGTKHERRSDSLFSDIGLNGKEYRYVSARRRTLERVIVELNGKPLSSGGLLKVTITATKDRSKTADCKLIFEKRARIEAVSAPTIADQEQSDAEKLVSYFHQVFFNAANVKPSRKELAHANELLTLHGFEIAKAVIETAKRESAKTSFEIATFGGVMQYQAKATGNAKAKIENEAKQKAIEEDQRRLRAEDDYFRFFEPAFRTYQKAELERIEQKQHEAFGLFKEWFAKKHQKGLKFIEGEARRTEITISRAAEFFADVRPDLGMTLTSFDEWDETHNADRCDPLENHTRIFEILCERAGISQ